MQAIIRKIQIVTERVKRLNELSAQVPSFTHYQSNQNYKDIAERNIHIAIEACLDIAKIIISQEKLDEPSDYKGLFVCLTTAGIIHDNMLSFLIPMAGIRNILVHSYDKIDDNIVYGILRKHLPNISAYIEEIQENYVNKMQH